MLIYEPNIVVSEFFLTLNMASSLNPKLILTLECILMLDGVTGSYG